MPADTPAGGPSRGEIADFRAARGRVLECIALAAARSGRSPDGITLVAVTKTVPIERLLAAAAAGITVMGENRVQEATPKVAALPEVEWHLVGQLQGNKAGRALELFDLIGSIDTVVLAERLSRLATGRTVRGLLQVNVDDDPAKAGFSEATLKEQLGTLLALPGLRVEGLMTVGRLVEHPADARRTFVALRRLSEQLRQDHPTLGPQLSMGMSEDFDIAVEEGATIVRVGRALFGDRPVLA